MLPFWFHFEPRDQEIKLDEVQLAIPLRIALIFSEM